MTDGDTQCHCDHKYTLLESDLGLRPPGSGGLAQEPRFLVAHLVEERHGDLPRKLWEAGSQAYQTWFNCWPTELHSKIWNIYQEIDTNTHTHIYIRPRIGG